VSAPLVSVVIPTRDRAPMLRQALQSVNALRASGIDLEIVLVDASADAGATAELAREFGARLLRRDSGLAAATRNAGMDLARGEFMMFLDDDDVVLPGHVRPHLELLRANPALGAVFGQIRLADSDLDEVGPPYPDPEDVGDPFAYFLARPQQIGSFVVRTSVRDTVGWLDEELLSSEDWDWELRLALRHEVAFVAQPCMLFRQRPAGTSDRLNAMRFRYLRRAFWRNVRRAGRRRPPVRTVAAMWARHCGLTAGHFLISGRGHVQAGDMAAARFAFRGALRTSPPHVAWALARQRDLLGLVVRAHLSRRATAL
jgi:glycosyltransferase involved in cell wall biosynthesis